MKESSITVSYKEYGAGELPADVAELVEAAKEAASRAYAPYSGFHVGAAIEMADGSVATGSNQENAAYPSGLCAERTAAFHASSQYPGMGMRRIAIAAWCGMHKPEGMDYGEYFQDSPVSPCGACRQALLEYEKLHGLMEVVLYGRKKTLVFPSVASLLPFSFSDF